VTAPEIASTPRAWCANAGALRWLLRHALRGGTADHAFTYGRTGDLPRDAKVARRDGTRAGAPGSGDDSRRLSRFRLGCARSSARSPAARHSWRARRVQGICRGPLVGESELTSARPPRCLKRRYGWHRSRLRGHDGAKNWCRYGVFAHNLGKIGALTA
jgi:hypothetical protein